VERETGHCEQRIGQGATCRLNVGSTLESPSIGVMQQLVDNDEVSIQRLDILLDIDENLP
jgi:hypothetical protein